MSIFRIQRYISEDADANRIITDFSSNKLIIKSDTGMGATQAVLNITNQQVIIISPMVGMIFSKERKRQSHQRFIYKDSADRWSDVKQLLDKGTNFILNTTPEQIVLLSQSNELLFNRIMNLPFFLDEFQMYCENDYRETLSKFYYLIFTQHKAHKTLSTATPTYHNLDIDRNFAETMQVCSIVHEHPRTKTITISDVKNYWNFVKKHCENGTKVVLFTNQEIKIKNLLNIEKLPYKVQYLAGEKLSTKLSSYRSKTNEEVEAIEKGNIDPDAQVYVLSTRYLIGMDIDFDCAIGILCEQNSEVDNRTYNEIIQAYGRGRRNIIDACVFYSSTFSPEVNIMVEEIKVKEASFTKDYLSDIQIPISKINQSMTYPRQALVNSLKENDFIVNIDHFDATIDSSSSDIAVRLRNLVNQDNSIQRNELKIVMSAIRGDDEHYQGFGTRSLLIWAAAYIIGFTKSSYLMKLFSMKNVRYKRILNRFKTFIDANDLEYPDLMTDLDRITKFRVSDDQIRIAKADGAICENYRDLFEPEPDEVYKKARYIINTLYMVRRVEDDEINERDLMILEGFEATSEILISDFINGLSKISRKDVGRMIETNDYESLNAIKSNVFHRINWGDVFHNTIQKIQTALSQYDYTMEEAIYIRDKIISLKSTLMKCEYGIYSTVKICTYSRKALKLRHKYFLLSLLSRLVAGHSNGFKVTYKDYREYNTATKTPRCLRKYLPYRMNEADIKCAFPTIIDKILDTNVAPEVYSNVQNKYGITRDEAKKKYNSMLNTHYLPRTEIIDFLVSAGYPTDKAKVLASKTNKKGAFYRLMTPYEDDAIFDFWSVNQVGESERLHDALLYYDLPEYQNIQCNISGFTFEIKSL